MVTSTEAGKTASFASTVHLRVVLTFTRQGTPRWARLDSPRSRPYLLGLKLVSYVLKLQHLPPNTVLPLYMAITLTRLIPLLNATRVSNVLISPLIGRPVLTQMEALILRAD